MTTIEAGQIVALTRCEAWRGDQTTHVSGLYALVERVPYEPSNYCWSAGWLVAPQDDDGEDACVFVEDDTLIAQVAPKLYGQMLESEREMDRCEEARDGCMA